MTISGPRYTRVLLFTGVLMLMPMQASGIGLSYDVALADNPGGNGNGKGQGQSRGGSKGGNLGTASAGTKGSAGAASNRGQTNSLNASVRASRNASSPSPVGAMTQYAAALGAFATIDATDDPTARELAAILSKVTNKDELTRETIDWIHQQLLSKEMVTQTTLDDAASILAPPGNPNADSNAVVIATPTLAELLAGPANPMQQSERNQELGPIY
jgi:hypothetical protein